MRHRLAGVRLSRTSAHRKALFSNLVAALFYNERIRTTDAKAKELRPFVERLITIAKRSLTAEEGSITHVNARRQVAIDIVDKAGMAELGEALRTDTMDEYNDVFVRMLEDVLSNYGEIFEVWFDGANGEGPNGKRQVYDWPRFHEVVRFAARQHPDVEADCGVEGQGLEHVLRQRAGVVAADDAHALRHAADVDEAEIDRAEDAGDDQPEQDPGHGVPGDRQGREIRVVDHELHAVALIKHGHDLPERPGVGRLHQLGPLAPLGNDLRTQRQR